MSEAGSGSKYRDERQVKLDVSRVPVSKAAQAKLEKRVATVLEANPDLHYYQGFHDIAQHTHSTKQLENLALQQLRDFMTPTLVPTIQILSLVPELIQAADPSGLGSFLKTEEPHLRKAKGYFALAPIITLFSHDCEDSVVIGHIIRTVLKEGLSYVLYFYVALFLTNGTTLLEKISPKSDDDEVDVALQGLGEKVNRENYLDLDRQARRLRSRYPLRSLSSWTHISRFSVLKTGKITKRSTALYTLGQLEKSTGGSRRLGTVASIPRAAVMAVAMGAIAAGMLWTRVRSK